LHQGLKRTGLDGDVVVEYPEILVAGAVRVIDPDVIAASLPVVSVIPDQAISILASLVTDLVLRGDKRLVCVLVEYETVQFLVIGYLRIVVDDHDGNRPTGRQRAHAVERLLGAVPVEDDRADLVSVHGRDPQEEETNSRRSCRPIAKNQV
jgi:hypothetical protein